MHNVENSVFYAKLDRAEEELMSKTKLNHVGIQGIINE